MTAQPETQPLSASGLRLVKVALVLQCGGALAIAFREAGPVEQALGAAALVGALVAAKTEHWLAAVAVAVWFAVLATTQMLVSNEHFAWIAIPAHATRVGIALAIARPRDATIILRVATSLTFAAHGMEALGLHPKFVAYVQVAGDRIGLTLTGYTTAMLRTIGCIDLLVAITFLRAGKQRAAAGYMGVWGLVTALARTVYAGPAGLPDTFLRVANSAAPLAVLLGWKRLSSTADPSSQGVAVNHSRQR